ncbi:MAG: hypothetical protein EOR84_21950 [Mesorhizobium sp.]|uniref:hypothetical protein n=1 Tax=Mesorhizobium sp. TaxID=1871066 RepID=UPI000FE921D1|nr:hypothetical protein [Mesorhizobium sp.]RWM90613.1 MAG: hypothetical protein EOR84_21950 [Mesorhizobium sp.]
MISRFLLALALFGLVLAPLAASSAVPAMAAQTMGSMPDSMPCCPDDQPAAPDCAKDCPLAVLCLSGLVSVPIPETPTFLVQIWIGDEFLAGRQTVLSSLAGEPQPRPPKA